VAAEDVVRLLVSRPDTRGIAAAVSSLLFGRGASIVAADQHSTDIADGRFFLCMEFTPAVDRGGLEAAFAGDVAARYVMDWRFECPADRKRVAIFASREDHCLLARIGARPIIEQDVERVSHRQNVLDLVRVGRDIERIALARAVAAHPDDRVLVFENRTVVL